MTFEVKHKFQHFNCNNLIIMKIEWIKKGSLDYRRIEKISFNRVDDWKLRKFPLAYSIYTCSVVPSSEYNIQ